MTQAYKWLHDTAVDEAVDFMISHTVEIGRLKAKAESWEALRKRRLALLEEEIVQAAQADGTKLTQAAIERAALASPAYGEHLRGAHEAVQAYETLKWEMESRKILISAWQSITRTSRDMPNL